MLKKLMTDGEYVVREYVAREIEGVGGVVVRMGGYRSGKGKMGKEENKIYGRKDGVDVGGDVVPTSATGTVSTPLETEGTEEMEEGQNESSMFDVGFKYGEPVDEEMGGSGGDWAYVDEDSCDSSDDEKEQPI